MAAFRLIVYVDINKLVSWMAISRITTNYHDKDSNIRYVDPCSLDPGTNLSGTDLHLPQGRHTGQPDLNPCRDD